jgi:two-component system, response regulator
MARETLVVVADDDELDMQLTTRAISRTFPEAHIVKCSDGSEALEQLQQYRGESEPRPTLVLMDFKMPKLGCLDVLRELDAPQMLEHVPFIVFSSSVGPSDVERCLQAGVREYVEKPTDPDKYREAVREIVERYTP